MTSESFSTECMMYNHRKYEQYKNIQSSNIIMRLSLNKAGDQSDHLLALMVHKELE